MADSQGPDSQGTSDKILSGTEDSQRSDPQGSSGKKLPKKAKAPHPVTLAQAKFHAERHPSVESLSKSQKRRLARDRKLREAISRALKAEDERDEQYSLRKKTDCEVQKLEQANKKLKAANITLQNFQQHLVAHRSSRP
jgi:hypothetical protein